MQQRKNESQEDYLERCKNYRKKYYNSLTDAQREKIRIYQRSWYQLNKERVKTRVRNRYLSFGAGVYFLYDSVGTLLYVGSSRSVETRLREHLTPSMRNKFKFDQSKTYIIPTPSWGQAQFIETYELARNPGLYNTIGKRK